MNKKILATLGAASLALTLSTTVSHALIQFEPGENVGLATGAPLPEGVFAIDDELYGQRDGNPGHTGLNIPEIVWSTPFSFYNTRVGVAAAFPFFHSDSYAFTGPNHVTSSVLTDDQTTFYNEAIGLTFSHDFGGGFGASLWTLYHTPNERYVPHNWADIRAALSYTGNGFDITAQFGYTGTFGSNNSGNNTGGPFPGGFINTPFTAGHAEPFITDAVNVDFTATKKFGKFELGFVGYAHTDIENGFDNANSTLNALYGPGRFPATGYTKAGAVAVGGLIGYDFGKFILQADVTREVASRGAPQLFTGLGKETRGMFRVTVPLYVAPAAPPAPVVARY